MVVFVFVFFVLVRMFLMCRLLYLHLGVFLFGRDYRSWFLCRWGKSFLRGFFLRLV